MHTMKFSVGIEVYDQHKGSSIKLPNFDNIEQVENFVKVASESSDMDHFYRIFGPEGFIVAYSVIGGKVRKHESVTIPREHW